MISMLSTRNYSQKEVQLAKTIEIIKFSFYNFHIWIAIRIYRHETCIYPISFRWPKATSAKPIQ
jgi:hypothetical protein